MMQHNSGLLGDYAGFITRGVALIIDILVVIVTVLVLTASISLPMKFFLNIDAQSCAADSVMLANVNWGFLSGLLCGLLNGASLAIALLTGPIYFIFLATAGGQTVGKYVMGVRVVRLDGKPMTYIDSTVRWLGYLVSLAPLGLGFVWVVIDDRRRSFHDKLARTCVIYSWRAQQNEYLIARIHRLFGRASKRGRVALMRALATQQYELVMIAVPNFNELNSLLRIVKNGIQNGEFEVLGLQEYAKSSDGQISYMDVDPMLEGVKSVMEFSEYGGLTPVKVRQIREELPNDHFILAVLIEEKDADQLAKLVARRTAAQVRRYELHRVTKGSADTGTVDQNLPAESAATPAADSGASHEGEALGMAFLATVPAPLTASTPATAQEGPLAVAQSAAAAQSTAAAQPSKPPVAPAPVSPAAPSPAQSAAPPAAQTPVKSERISSPVEQSASNGAPSAVVETALLPDLARTVNELKELQAAMQVALAARNEALLSAQQRTEAEPVEPPPSLAVPIVEVAGWQRRYPAISNLGEKLAALPETKTTAIDAAVASYVLPRLVTTPQDLAAIRGIGPVFEQRLYRAGVGTFWEVATLDDSELHRILALTDLQFKQVDLPSIREDAHRLAVENDAIGLIWQGKPPDDFEPIEGVGPVFEQRLYDAGIRTYAALAAATPEELAQIVKAPKPSQPDFAGWIEQARRLGEQRES